MVELVGDRVEIREKVFFELDSAVIQADSFDLLDEVERLTAAGYGETRPLAEGENETAWSQNRRVEFHAEAWADQSAGQPSASERRCYEEGEETHS